MAINYIEINSRALNILVSAKKHISSIDNKLKAIVELRVSQINGCAYCVDSHTNEAREAGELQQKLDCLTVWKESLLFSDAEMAALSWAESVTNISTEPDVERKLNQLQQHFSEKEIVDLTLTISLMNFWNRMAISFSDKPAKRNA